MEGAGGLRLPVSEFEVRFSGCLFQKLSGTAVESARLHTHGAAEAAVTLALELRELGLLFRREDLVESRTGFCFDGSQLAGKTADGGRVRVDGGRIVTGYRGLQGLAGGFHAGVQRGCSRSRRGEDSSGLLLLCGGERQERSQEGDTVLHSVASRGRRGCGCRARTLRKRKRRRQCDYK